MLIQADQSPLLFVLCMIPWTLILRNSTAGYDLAKEFKVNQLLFMEEKIEQWIRLTMGLATYREMFSGSLLHLR